MSDPILDKRVFETTVGGVVFKLRRRSTFLMAEARGIRTALGIIGGEQAIAEGKVKADSADDGYRTIVESILRVALVEPRLSESGQPSDPPREYSMEDIAPFADGLFAAVMSSGLEVSPSPSSCGDGTEPKPQEHSIS